MSIFAQGAFQIDPNSTPEQIRRKREAIAKLMPQFGKARYVGEGIGQLAYGIGSGMQERALDKQEAAGTAAAGDIYSGILSRVSSRAPSGGSTYSAAPAPRPTSESQVLADDVMSALGKDAASQFGGIESQYSLPPGYLDRTYEVESGRNPNARNPNSSAGGGFQFIDSTARAYGLTDKTDLGASADAAARLARDNSAQLRAVLGREPTAAELYLAHQQGGAGAAKLLSNPNARAVDIVGFDAVRLNGGDANMTAGEFASKWTGKFGGGPPVMSTQNAPTQAGGIPMADLYAAMANPWMSAEQRAVIGSMIQQQEQADDPMRQMQMEKARLELAQLRNPQAKQTDDIREYEFARSQGYEGTFTDFMTAMRRAGATSITNTVGGDNTPGIGKLSTDYGYVLDENGQIKIDPQTGLPQAAPVPGSPAAQDVQKLEKSQGVKAGNAKTVTDTITTAASRARDAAAKREFGGFGASVIGKINPYSDSAEVNRQVDVLKAQAKIGNLQSMRDASPTGGALGAVTAPELQMLADQSGALDPASPNFLRDLDDYERTLLRTIHGPEAGDAIYAETRGGGVPSGDGWTVIDGVRIREKQ
jgi:hypothetical protein